MNRSGQTALRRGMNPAVPLLSNSGSVPAPATDRRNVPLSLRQESSTNNGFDAVAFLANAGLGKVIEEVPNTIGTVEGAADDMIQTQPRFPVLNGIG